MLKTSYKPIIQLKSPLDRSMGDEKISRSPYTYRSNRKYQYKVFQYNKNNEDQTYFAKTPTREKEETFDDYSNIVTSNRKNLAEQRISKEFSYDKKDLE